MAFFIWFTIGFAAFVLCRLMWVHQHNVSARRYSFGREERDVCEVSPAVLLGIFLSLLVGPMMAVPVFVIGVVWFVEVIATSNQFKEPLFNICDLFRKKS